MLRISKIFYSLQCEGPRAGQPAVFIRLAGCNLSCPFCDTDHITGAKDWEEDGLLEEVLRWPQANLVVITGGEPFLQDFSDLCEKISLYDKHIQIETNGTNLPAWYHDVSALPYAGISIVCSPKNMEVDKEMMNYAEAFKYVVRAGELYEGSGLPEGVFNPLGHAGHWLGAGQIFLQPMDEKNADKNKANMQAAVASCLQHGYSLSLQQQKIIGCE